MVHGNSQCIPKKPGGHIQSPVTGSQPCGQPQYWRHPSPYLWYGQSYEQPISYIIYTYVRGCWLSRLVVIYFKIEFSYHETRIKIRVFLHLIAIQWKLIIFVILVEYFFPEKTRIFTHIHKEKIRSYTLYIPSIYF